MADAPGTLRLLSGTVEADETFVGGKPRRPRYGKSIAKEKAIVMALVERGGDARARVIERVTSRELKGMIRRNVHRDARIITDEHASYQGLKREFRGGHETVRHGYREYVRRGTISTSTRLRASSRSSSAA